MPKAKWATAIHDANRWWLVESPQCATAKQLCDRWPQAVADPATSTRILNTGKGGD